MKVTSRPKQSETVIELKPIKETKEEWDQLEARIKELFKREIYFPLLAELGESQAAIKNAKESALTRALRTGRITFHRGQFSGRFNAEATKELKRLGAQWDRKTGTFKVSHSSLPVEIRQAISTSESRFQQQLAGIDQKLAQILPEEIADRLKSADLFDRSIYKTDKAIQESAKRITITPELSKEARKKVADEWQNNMKLWIKDFTQDEITKLRRKMKKQVFTGNRYESAVKTIQESYGVSANKAKFLARQETSLLTAKLKETRYTDAGVMEYKWGTVTGTSKHPVRPSHKILEGKIFRWDNPPITTAPGQPARKNNPGQDYNCRCFAKPIVRFKA